tara:strand:+ start:4858 stop:5415 length:558 start_codon:yes stop_codon:yes gene_type:complete
MPEIFIEENVEEVPKPKRKRKPLSEEAKEKLRDRLKKAREAKTAKKVGAKAKLETIPEVKAEEVKAEVAEVAVAEPKVTEPTANQDLINLQNELNNLKLEKLEALEKKNEKKKAQIAKRKATIARKALENDIKKKVETNVVTKPAPPRKCIIDELDAPSTITAPSAPIDIPKPKYSTYKKSVWNF